MDLGTDLNVYFAAAYGGLQQAHDAMPSTGGVIVLAAGTTNLPSTFHITKPCRVMGMGMGANFDATSAGVVLPSGQVMPNTPHYFVSRLAHQNPSTPAVLIDAYPVIFEGVDVYYSGSDTPVAGNCGIRMIQGYNNKILCCTVNNFYDNIRVETMSAEYTIRDCNVNAPHRYGMYLNNVGYPDYADQTISGCWIKAGIRNAQAAIKIEGGGGIKISDLKVNGCMHSDNTQKKFVHGIHWDNLAGGTVDFLLSNASIENFSGSGVKIKASQPITDVLLSNVQISPYSNTGLPAVDIEGCESVNVSSINSYGVGNMAPVVRFTNVNRGMVGSIINNGFAADFERVGGSNILKSSFAAV